MRLGFELSLKQTQKLIMTQELRQAIQILQYTSHEIQEFINKQIEMNPVIELNHKNNSTDKEINQKNIDWKEYFKQNNFRNYNSYIKDDETNSPLDFLSYNKSLKEHLLLQLNLNVKEKKRIIIGEYIIDNIDENGYLTTSLLDISKQLNIDIKCVEETLKIIQTFDPIGVASRDIKECLITQLRMKKIKDENVYKVVEFYLDELARNRLSKISKELNISIKEVQFIADIIKSLEPKPGGGFPGNKNEVRYVIPDAFVKLIDGEFVIEINEITAPKIYISNYYKNLLNNSKDENTIEFLNSKLNSAMWLIKSLEQRRNTIYNVIKSIIKFQKEFFLKGDSALKPLTLKDIANDIEVHESTVSRAINGKYIETPRGIFKLKFFFSSGVSNDNGGIASKSIKVIIKEIIENENPNKPLSDQNISEILINKGIKISRRTVTKYRDELNIPSSSRRKRF